VPYARADAYAQLASRRRREAVTHEDRLRLREDLTQCCPQAAHRVQRDRFGRVRDRCHAERNRNGGCASSPAKWSRPRSNLHALDDAGRDANVEAARERPGMQDAVLIHLMRREQGLLVAKGNPLALAGIADAVTIGVRIAQRPRGAGAQLLLPALLQQNGLDTKFLGSGVVCPTGTDLAQAIVAGRADCGVASRSAAAAAGLDFVPLVWERFDLVMRQRDYFRPAQQKLLAFARTTAFARRAAEMTGYDVTDTGTVRYVA
jgi:molybdate-binding protein